MSLLWARLQPNFSRNRASTYIRHYSSRNPENANFDINTLIPERKNDGSVARISHGLKLVRGSQHGLISLGFSWVPKGVTIRDAYLAMTKHGLEVRRLSKDTVLHKYPLLDMILNYNATMEPLIRMAIQERIITEKHVKTLGYGCPIETGVPTTMKRRRRPPSFHLAHYHRKPYIGFTYKALPEWVETISFAFNPLAGLPGSRRIVVITNPIYATKPHHLQFNPVCYISPNGERSLRLVEWSTGAYLRQELRGQIKIWEMNEEVLNKRDPRWVPQLQSLELWPATSSHDNIELDAKLEEIAKRCATEHMFCSHLSNTKNEIFNKVQQSVLSQIESNTQHLAPSLLETIVRDALTDIRHDVKHMLKASDSLSSLTTKTTKKYDIHLDKHALHRLAVLRSVYQENPGCDYWDRVDDRFTALRESARVEATPI